MSHFYDPAELYVQNTLELFKYTLVFKPTDLQEIVNSP